MFEQSIMIIIGIVMIVTAFNFRKNTIKKQMKVVCSSCKKFIRYKEGPPSISHGMCIECAKEFYKDDFTQEEIIKMFN